MTGNILTAEEQAELKKQVDHMIRQGPNRFATFVQRLHPTHQQDFWRFIDAVACRYADNNFVDMRNQASIDYCKAIAELDSYFPVV